MHPVDDVHGELVFWHAYCFGTHHWSRVNFDGCYHPVDSDDG